ncbi:MAG: hypothetical protein M1833_006287 [Piccolia ochrophora]|nr:MAG: hypothetical protein M1833_006287 [Piccolia ochrophora]
MAYDQHSHYLPPPRQYMGQQNPESSAPGYPQSDPRGAPLQPDTRGYGSQGGRGYGRDQQGGHAGGYGYPESDEYAYGNGHGEAYGRREPAMKGYPDQERYPQGPSRGAEYNRAGEDSAPDPYNAPQASGYSNHQPPGQPVNSRSNPRGYDDRFREDGGPSPHSQPSRGPQESVLRPPKPSKHEPNVIPAPEPRSWDNPFPTFPSAKKKDPTSDRAPPSEAMSTMNIGKSSSAGQLSFDPSPQRAGNQGGQRPDGSRDNVYNGAMPHNERRPPPHRQDHTPPVAGREQTNHQHQPNHEYNYHGMPPSQRPMDDPYARQRSLDGPRPTRGDGWSEPNTAPVSPQHAGFGAAQRSMTMPANLADGSNEFGGGQRRLPPSQSGYSPQVRGQNQHPAGAGLPHRPNPGLRQYSDESARGRGVPPPGSNGTRQTSEHRDPNTSVGEVFDSYFELPGNEPDNAYGSQPPTQSAMPRNNSASRSHHQRGMSIEQHLTPTGNSYGVPDPADAYGRRGPGVQDDRHLNFAKQAQNSRSHPNLRANNTASPGPRDYPGGTFEMPGDVPPARGPDGRAPRQGYGPPGQGFGPPGGHNPRQAPPYNQPLGGRRPGDRPPPQRFHQGNGPPHAGPGPTGPSPPGRDNSFAPGRSHPGQPPRMQVGTSESRGGPSGARPPHPDALPQHPVPVRPGLMPGSSPTSGQPTKPPPVRQYNSPAERQNSMTSQKTSASQERRSSGPVTHEEIARLQQAADANPSDQATQLLLAKKWVEAAAVLVDEGGRMDAKARNRNREKYIMDAHKLIKRLVGAGNPDAMFYLADSYGMGRLGLEVDTKEAFNLYQAAAKAGHPQSAYRTAVCCEMGQDDGGGTRKDPVRAYQWYKRAAALGDPPAMYKMGVILLKGLLGQPRNPREAVVWLKRAADRADAENPHALHELGLLYEQASGNDSIIRDEQYSKQLFHQAAELGYKFSQFRLGCAYEYGLMNCPIDPRQSIAFYSAAAVQGEHQSELALSGWYLTGTEGVLQQSDTEAYLWARKAAQAGLAKAEYAMGYFTEVGIGCPANLDESKRWYWKSAAQNFPKARERLDELRKGGAKSQKSRERISRSRFTKQNKDECLVM